MQSEAQHRRERSPADCNCNFAIGRFPVNIPAKAYDYVVNGKSAIEWVMERYQITTHKYSGIRNAPNDWANGATSCYPPRPAAQQHQRNRSDGGNCGGLPGLDFEENETKPFIMNSILPIAAFPDHQFGKPAG